MSANPSLKHLVIEKRFTQKEYGTPRKNKYSNQAKDSHTKKRRG